MTYYVTNDLSINKNTMSQVCEICDHRVFIGEQRENDGTYLVFAVDNADPVYIGFAYIADDNTPVVNFEDCDFVFDDDAKYDSVCEAVQERLEKIKEFFGSNQITCYISFNDKNCGFDRNDVPCTPTQEPYPCSSSESDYVEFTAIGMTLSGEEIKMYWQFEKYDDNGNLIDEFNHFEWTHPDNFEFI